MRWEYLVIDLSKEDNIDGSLISLGDVGWELVAVDNGIAYFKRLVAN